MTTARDALRTTSISRFSTFKEYLKLLNRLYYIIRYNLVWVSLHLINREAVYEKYKLTETRLYKYNLFYTSITCSTISNIPYNLIFTTKFNDSSILITIISCDYLNLSLADEHVGDVTIPTQAIEYNQHFL